MDENSQNIVLINNLKNRLDYLNLNAISFVKNKGNIYILTEMVSDTEIRFILSGKDLA